MAKKVKRAFERLKQGRFAIPSPQEIEDAKSPAGAWTALQLAGWGVKWPPQHGWKAELERKWVKANGRAATKPKLVLDNLEDRYRDALEAILNEVHWNIGTQRSQAQLEDVIKCVFVIATDALK